MIAGLLALLAGGCLPHGALGTADQAPAVGWRIESGGRTLVLTRQYARAFRDGSNGWLFCLDGTDRCTEMRAFPDGQVLTLHGLDTLGEADRAELLAVWPLLSPRLDTTEGLLSSWPMGHRGRVQERVGARGGWTKTAGAWKWEAALGHAGVFDRGELGATVEVDAAGTRSARWDIRLAWCVDEDCGELRRSGRLVRLETAFARRAVEACPGGVDPARTPLCLAEGRIVADDPGATAGLRPGRSDTMPMEP
jgi:hypothetical protein